METGPGKFWKNTEQVSNKELDTKKSLEGSVIEETTTNLTEVELSTMKNEVKSIDAAPDYPTEAEIKKAKALLKWPKMKHLVNNVLKHLHPSNPWWRFEIHTHMKKLTKAMEESTTLSSLDDKRLKINTKDKKLGFIPKISLNMWKTIREIAINEAIATYEPFQDAVLNFLMEGFVEYIDDYKELRLKLSSLYDQDVKLNKVLTRKEKKFLREWSAKNPVADYKERLKKLLKWLWWREQWEEIFLKMMMKEDPYSSDKYLDKLQKLFKVYISDAALFDDEELFNERLDQFSDAWTAKPSNMSYGWEKPLLGNIDNPDDVDTFLDDIKID